MVPARQLADNLAADLHCVALGLALRTGARWQGPFS